MYAFIQFHLFQVIHTSNFELAFVERDVLAYAKQETKLIYRPSNFTCL